METGGGTFDCTLQQKEPAGFQGCDDLQPFLRRQLLRRDPHPFQLPIDGVQSHRIGAVKRGGDRQELHEKIRQHSMAATAQMKEGEPCDLLDRLAADPAFSMTRAELDAVMEPSLYIGRCKEQVERLLAEYAPLLTDAQTADGAISL